MTTQPNTYRKPTDQIGVTHTVRISCDCPTCEINAKTVGHTFPLAAYMTEAGAAQFGITEKNANRRTKTHFVIEMAHHPFFSAGQRAAIPVAQ